VFDEGDNLRRPRWQRELISLSLRRATVNVFCSRLEYETVPRHFRVRRPGYVPLSVDTQLYRPGGARQEPFLLTMAWTGGVNAVRKCIPELVQAAAIVHRRHPEVRFVVAGERGDSYPQLARLVRELGAEGYVEFPGVVSREEKIDLMQRCQLYLQPSRWEGFGLAILEAMSCGAAVVTSPAGVVPEVAGNAARLVDGTSPSTFAQAIIQLLDDPASRHELGRCARERAERHFPLTRRKHAMSRLITALVRV
jgi:glycosyltransferase involved in cell wall biosynthesis